MSFPLRERFLGDPGSILSTEREKETEILAVISKKWETGDKLKTVTPSHEHLKVDSNSEGRKGSTVLKCL